MKKLCFNLIKIFPVLSSIDKELWSWNSNEVSDRLQYGGGPNSTCRSDGPYSVLSGSSRVSRVKVVLTKFLIASKLAALPFSKNDP